MPPRLQRMRLRDRLRFRPWSSPPFGWGSRAECDSILRPGQPPRVLPV